MAFFGKLGGLLRQNAAHSALLKSGVGAVAPALLVLQRGMSGSKLFIGGNILTLIPQEPLKPYLCRGLGRDSV